MALDQTQTFEFNPTAVLPNPEDPEAAILVPRGQLRDHLPPFVKRQRLQTKISRTPITFYFAKAENEERMILGSSGFKNDMLLGFDEIKELNQTGTSVLWMALPNPERKTNFLPHFINAARDILIDPPHQEIDRWLKRDVPKVFMGHSTGAQLFFHLMKQEDTHKKLTEEFSGAVLPSPYIRSTYAAAKYNPAYHFIRRYFAANPEKIAPETRLGRWFLSSADVKTLEEEIGSDEEAKEIARAVAEKIGNNSLILPAYGQILELLKGGDEVLNDVSDKNSKIQNRGDFPIMIFAGHKDRFSCPSTSKYLAKKIDAGFHDEPNAKHASISTENPSFAIFQDSLTAITSGRFNELKDELAKGNYIPRYSQAASSPAPA